MALRSILQLRTIGAKLMASVTVTALVAAGAVGVAGYWQQDALSDQAIESALTQRYEAVVAAMADQGQRAAAAARSIANDPRSSTPSSRTTAPPCLPRPVSSASR